MSTGEELPHSKEAAASIFKACAVKDHAASYILHNVGNYLPIDVASYKKKYIFISTAVRTSNLENSVFVSGGEWYDLFNALFKQNQP